MISDQKYQILNFIRTGTRIRTQIKGFGDPYATVAPYPYES
jgi:hypothetical protein